jgi:hypothetical protein
MSPSTRLRKTTPAPRPAHRARLLRSAAILCGTLGAAQALAAPTASSTKATPTATQASSTPPQLQLSPAAQGTIGNAPSFTALSEVRRIASAKLAALNKTAIPTSAEPTSLTISLDTQAPGSTLDLMGPDYVKLSPYKHATFKTTMATVFRPERPRVELTVAVQAAQLYVLDCVITGVGSGHHRLEFAGAGARLATVETRANSATRGRFLVTYLAERAGELRLALQGHLVDGDDYSWSFGGCRVTPVPYR